jgi:hypothetical protein
VDYTFRVGVSANDLKGIANTVAAGVRGAWEIENLKLRALEEITMEGPSYVLTKVPNHVHAIVHSVGRSDASPGHVDGRPQNSGGALDSVFNAG